MDELHGVLETLAVNRHRRVVPPADRVLGYGEWPISPPQGTNDRHRNIPCGPWGTYLGKEKTVGGHPRHDLLLAWWGKHDPAPRPPATGSTSTPLMLAVHEAQRAGYDEAILLTHDGVRRPRLARASSPSPTA